MSRDNITSTHIEMIDLFLKILLLSSFHFFKDHVSSLSKEKICKIIGLLRVQYYILCKNENSLRGIFIEHETLYLCVGNAL